MKKRLFTIVVLLLVASCMATVLIACAPKSKEDAIKKLETEELGYVSNSIATSAVKIVLDTEFDGIDEVYLAATKDAKNSIIAIWFKTTADAKACLKELEEKADEYSSYLKGVDLEEGSKPVVKRSGKLVYIGTEKAAKDFAK
ncbi:MAG: hypothetical protein LBU04_01065 [Christensenellaceae bacterium]|jgi:hypothetical protein|nr:hypothetical protein [Christensenellaceae bacterium]